MSTILTKAATEQCTHGGTVKLGVADGTLTIDGNAVYTKSAITAAAVAGCSNTNAPCTKAADPGTAVLTVNGNAVLLVEKLTTGPANAVTLTATVTGAPTYVTTD
jgi:hypothetical protein